MWSPSVQWAEQMERQRMEGLDKCGGHQCEHVWERHICWAFFFCLFFLNSHSKHGSLFLSCAVGSVSPSIFLKLVWSLPAKLWAFRCRLIRRLCMKSYQVRETTLGHLENTSLPLRSSCRHTLEEFFFFFFLLYCNSSPSGRACAYSLICIQRISECMSVILCADSVMFTSSDSVLHCCVWSCVPVSRCSSRFVLHTRTHTHKRCCHLWMLIYLPM